MTGLFHRKQATERWYNFPPHFGYDTIRDAILTCARKPTWVGLIYRTELPRKGANTEVTCFYLNINTKNCSLSIVLTATDQKPQKSLKRSYYSASRRAGFKCVEALGRITIRGPLPTLKCYNLHALTIVIITKYIYIYFYTLWKPLSCGGPWATAQFAPSLNPALVKRISEQWGLAIQSDDRVTPAVSPRFSSGGGIATKSEEIALWNGWKGMRCDLHRCRMYSGGG